MHHRINPRLSLISIHLLLFMIISVHERGFAQVISGGTVERIWTGFQFVEGPVWKNGVGLLFSDVARSTIYRWTKSDSTMSIYLKPSDSSNGLTLDHQGNLILTQMQKRRIARQEIDGTITPLVSTYNGKRFNSPNDIIVTSKGSILFTDPDFNVPVGELPELKIKGIYRLNPSGGLSVIDSTFTLPNGICLAPDESRLYVNESALHKIFVWDMVNDSTFTNKRLFYTIPQTGYADGMKVDSSGNVYCAGPSGIWVVTPSGVFITLISTPETPSNCTWGDSDRKTLYITAQTSIYRIRPGIATGVKMEMGKSGTHFELGENYPNPFNPRTVIRYTIPGGGGSRNYEEGRKTSLTVYDILGREVAVLVSEAKPPGTYEVVFDGNNLASGMYVYRLQSGEFVSTRKAALIR